MIAALPLSVSAAGEYVPGNPRWSGYQNQVQWGRPAGAASGDSFEYEAQLLLGDDVVESKAVEIDTYLFFTNDVVTRPQEEYTIRVRARWIMIVGDPDGQYMVADVGEAEPPHEHSYTQKHDAAQHWKECSCGERLNVANHIYGDWRETKPATETEAGSRERDCTVCDYVQTETIPMLEHEHSYREPFVPWHWHNAIELFYMESGELKYYTPHETLVFPAGSAGMVNANVLHKTQLQSHSEKNIQLLHIFDPQLLAGNRGSLTSLIKTVQLFLLLSIFQCKTTVCKVRPSFCICISVLFIGTVGYCFSLKHFTVLRRGNTFLLLENTAEIKRILITDNSGYFCHIVVRGFQKADSVIDSNGQYVLHGRFHSHLLEIP